MLLVRRCDGWHIPGHACTRTQPLGRPSLPPSLCLAGCRSPVRLKAGSGCFSSPGAHGSSCGTRAQGSEGVPAPAGGPRRATLGMGGRQSPRRLGHRARNLPRTFPPYIPTPTGARHTLLEKDGPERAGGAQRKARCVRVRVCVCVRVGRRAAHGLTRPHLQPAAPSPPRVCA